ncbi:MAG: 50S ribosomal protein L15 [Candidatus Vogelbacteria bacterium CG22_combo_CG10-13_8_21_14_all_37_9]|uniref:Large ribosomal subunit protein uL15 n=1 Tax=Candidatus Vogelbacteria bacterium CG22_combo_CG10-13_8_21_14_all_37_9 TaxID=1975046 RepID=A0A2H0BKH2_9BACT|nr:MAG: 50S ribosomal protein L15 [bacterium CG10_37_50]PIP58176.1 MAG: 50S ribosomal protein L15 [Candidatus Vogelbacteria bacterium CG22_combo_CG10-13_8_21_14_all_37_9]
MQIHDLKRKNKQKSQRQIGRGGKRGTTSGRGTKGQKARAGRKLRPEMRDIIKKLPKLRGYKMSSNPLDAYPLSLGVLNNKFEAGEEISLETLKAKGLIETRKGKLPVVKVLANGPLAKGLIIKGLAISANAKAKIEKMGGQVL